MHLFSGVCLCSLCIIQSAQCLRERQKDGPPCFVLLPFLRCVCDIERDTPEEVKKNKKLGGKLVHWDRSHLHTH